MDTGTSGDIEQPIRASRPMLTIVTLQNKKKSHIQVLVTNFCPRLLL
jgi:hypothetical protein